MSSSSYLPKDSLIVISGANGFIASHIVDILLELGYRVRGTVRDLEKTAWLQELFDGKYGKGRFERVQVPDISKDGAFDDALQGASSFVHAASDLSFSPNPNDIITPVLASVKSALTSAANTPTVKTFVLTSSSTAASAARPNEKFHVDASLWNEADIKAAWAPAPYEQSRAWAVYGASKAQGEQALWDFVKTAKPSFSANAILPNANFGPVIEPKHQSASTAGWIRSIYAGKFDTVKNFPPQYFVNVRDTARLHAAVATDPSISGQRVFAYATPYHWDTILDHLRKTKPDFKDYPDNLDDGKQDLSTVDNGPALAILKARFGQSEWIPLEQSVSETVADL